MDKIIYQQSGLPIFQNKVYSNRNDAINTPVGDVELVQCNDTGLVYNHLFVPELVNYDENYQNEQACSPSFKRHLESVLDILIRKFGTDKVGVEVGCGKGYFLEMLNNAGVNITGFDPAYQGTNPLIKKELYNSQDTTHSADYIILRHVLEHIKDPWSFLESLSSACKDECEIYIEVPCFNWIVNHYAFYDIFYEHCNYFTIDNLQCAFIKIEERGYLFGDQYMYVIAKLKTFNKPKLKNSINYDASDFKNYMNNIISMLNNKNKTYIWGAGAKGVTFANILMNKGYKLSGLVDINPVKQGKFIGLSGLEIFDPASLNLNNTNLIVMNPVYFNEIKLQVKNFNTQLISVV